MWKQSFYQERVGIRLANLQQTRFQSFALRDFGTEEFCCN